MDEIIFIRENFRDKKKVKRSLGVTIKEEPKAEVVACVAVEPERPIDVSDEGDIIVEREKVEMHLPSLPTLDMD